METLPRSSVGETISEIRDLLNEALQTGNDVTGQSWINADATRLLLSELELYAGNYDTAAEISSALLDRKGYDCFGQSVYRSLWDGTSCDERIFIYDDPSGAQNYYIGIVYDSGSGDYFCLDPRLAASYEDNDCRKSWTVVPYYSQSLGNVDLIGKYNLLRREKREISFINKMRLSHALFTAAEAWCLGGHPDKAVDALNRFLGERGATPVDPSLTGNSLLREILSQKQKEFAGEGERYFDIKHYRAILGATLDSRLPSGDDYRWQWPLPKEEYLYNDKADQNPGWPKVTFSE